MSTYTVETTCPVFVDIAMDDDGRAVVVRVVAADESVPVDLDGVIAAGGRVMDENGLTVKPTYSDGQADPDWHAIERAYRAADDDGWPAWSFGA